MYALLTFAGSSEHDLAVAKWFEARPGPLGSIAREWFALMRTAGPDVLELLHDGCPVVCVQDAPFAYVNVFRAHVNVGFFRGAQLDDPKGILEGTGKFMRHVKLRPGEPCDEAALKALIVTAHRDMQGRVARGE